MKVIKTEKQTKEVDVTVENYEVCDKCNERIFVMGFDSFECSFEHKTGNQYPEGGGGKTETMDLCQSCAKEAVELLKANGYRINTEEWDY